MGNEGREKCVCVGVMDGEKVLWVRKGRGLIVGLKVGNGVRVIGRKIWEGLRVGKKGVL